MSFKNAQLRVSPMTNEIYLCTVSKKDSRVANAGKVNFTQQCLGAMIQHMQGIYKDNENNCYEVPNLGRLVWEPLPQAIETTEIPSASSAVEEVNP